MGSSAQGFTNALLFCVFTSVVRKKLVGLVRDYLCCMRWRRKGDRTYLLEPSTEHTASSRMGAENTTQFEDEEELWRKSLYKQQIQQQQQRQSGSRKGSSSTRVFNDSLEGSMLYSKTHSLEGSKCHSVKRVSAGGVE